MNPRTKSILAAVLVSVLAAGSLTACGSRAPEVTTDAKLLGPIVSEGIRTELVKMVQVSGELQKTALETKAAWDAGIGEYSGIKDPDALRCLQELDKQKMMNSGTGTGAQSEDGSFVIGTTGGYVLSEDDRKLLQDMLNSVYVPGFTMGFLMMDLGTGEGVTFNTEQTYYSASSTKASFVVSLIRERPEAAEKNWQQLIQITTNSDNDSYFELEYDYGQDIHLNYAAGVGVNLAFDEGGFAEITAEDLARLWLANYDYFQTGQQGETVGQLFEAPTYSSICSLLGGMYVTRTKPGWIAGELHNASMDAGIIYADEHPYLMVVMTDFPSNLEDLGDTVVILDQLHRHMFEETAGEGTGEDGTEKGTAEEGASGNRS